MDEILNNLLVGEILYSTSNGTQYLYMGRNNNFDVVYSINQEQKTLPLNTINAAFEAFNLGEEIMLNGMQITIFTSTNLDLVIFQY